MALLALVPLVTGNLHLYKTVANTVFKGRMGPDIDEQDIFDFKTVETGAPQPWPTHKDFNKTALPKAYRDTLEMFESTAFVVIKNSQLIYEEYWEGTNAETASNSWSMAKSFTGVLIGVAIDEGKIKSVEQKVGDFLPQFKEGRKNEITIKHLLQMCPGILWGEDYKNPVGYMATTLYGDDVRDITFEYDVEEDPNTKWRYQGGATLLLSFIIKEATGKSVAEYASEKLWKPMGAEHNAIWSLDDEGGDEKAFCCFFTNARDFARFGELYLRNGNWKGKQLVSEQYVKDCLMPVNLPDKNGRKANHYGYQWWMGKHKGEDFFMARGLQGQYIFGFPKHDLVVVRLGHKRSKINREGHPIDVYAYLEAALKVSGN